MKTLRKRRGEVRLDCWTTQHEAPCSPAFHTRDPAHNPQKKVGVSTCWSRAPSVTNYTLPRLPPPLFAGRVPKRGLKKGCAVRFALSRAQVVQQSKSRVSRVSPPLLLLPPVLLIHSFIHSRFMYQNNSLFINYSGAHNLNVLS